VDESEEDTFETPGFDLGFDDVCSISQDEGPLRLEDTVMEEADVEPADRAKDGDSTSHDADSSLFKVPAIPATKSTMSTNSSSVQVAVSQTHDPSSDDIDQDIQDLDDGNDAETVTSDADPTFVVAMEDVEKPSDVCMELQFKKFILSESDPFPSYKYGPQSDLTICDINPRHIYLSMLTLAHLSKDFKLPEGFMDFLDDITFNDIALLCSDAREKLELDDSLSTDLDDLNTSQTYEQDTKDKWQTLLEAAKKIFDNSSHLSNFFEMIQLVQHAKVLGQRLKNEGNCDFWKCADLESRIRAFTEICLGYMYPFYHSFSVDNDLRHKTLHTVREEYLKGYELLEKLLDGEHPFLLLYSIKSITQEEIKQFRNKLLDHCKKKSNQFERSDVWSYEKYLFAQKVLGSLRKMKLEEAEESISCIYECIRIRNEFSKIKLDAATANLHNWNWEVHASRDPDMKSSHEEKLDLEQNIMPHVRNAAVQGAKAIQDSQMKKLCELDLRLYLSTVAELYMAKRIEDPREGNRRANITTIDDVCLDNFVGHKYFDSIRGDLKKIADFVENSETDAGWEALNRLTYLIFRDISIYAINWIKSNGGSQLAIDPSRFLTHGNVEETRILSKLVQKYLNDYTRGDDQMKCLASTRFKNSLKVVENLVREKGFEKPWKSVLRAYETKIGKSEVIKEMEACKGLSREAETFRNVSKSTDLQDLMFLEQLKSRMFWMCEKMDDLIKAGQKQQSLLRPTMPMGHDSGNPMSPAATVPSSAPDVNVVDPPGADIIPAASLGTRVHSLPVPDLLLAQPFKKAYVHNVKHEDVRTWADQIDMATLQKSSTHAVREAVPGDVYIFQLDLPLKEAKNCDHFLWKADGGGKKAIVDNIQRVYYRAMNIDGEKNNKITKVAYVVKDEGKNIIVWVYKNGTEGCLPIGTLLRVPKKTTRKRKASDVDSDDGMDREEEDTDNPTAVADSGTQTETTSDPTAPTDTIYGGLFKMPATSVSVGIDPHQVWKIHHIAEAFQYATENKLFQDGYRYAINDPKPGDIYCINATNMSTATWFHDIKLDSYSWSDVTKASEKNPSNKHSFMMYKYAVFTSTGHRGQKRKLHSFRKHIYYETHTSNLMFVYKGSLDGVERGRHLNSKHNTRPHITVAKEVAEKIRQAAERGDSAGKTLMELRANVPSGLLADRLLPRNMPQVIYQRAVARKTRELSKDQMLYSMLAVRHVGSFCIHHNAVDFNHYFIGRSEAAVNEFKKALKINEDRKVPTIIGYDTSFETNRQGYLSPICYGHPALRTQRKYGNDHFPNAMAVVQTMIHQTKDRSNHLDNFAKLDIEFNLKSKDIVIVTDKEFKGSDLIQNAKTVYCWNHVRKAVQRKAAQLFKMEVYHQKLLFQSVTYLMESDTIDVFHSRLDDLYHGRCPQYQDSEQSLARLPATHRTCCTIWQEPTFQNYFDTHVKDDIVQYSGTWYLQSIGVPDPHHGLTSNRSECLNHMTNCFKKNLGFVDRKKPSVAESIIMLKVFTDTVDSDIYLGYYGTGPYNVCPSLPHLKRDPATRPAFTTKLFKEYMNELHKAVEKKNRDPDSDDEMTEDSDVEEAEEEEEQRHPVEIFAKMYLDQDCIIDDKRGSWIVREVNVPINQVADHFSVVVQPGYESCSCADKYAKKVNICAHYLAVAVHCKLRAEPRLTDQERKEVEKPPPKTRFTSRPGYGKKTPTTLNKANPHNVLPTRARMLVDTLLTRGVGSPRAPRTPRTPRTPNTLGTPTALRTPGALPTTPRTPDATSAAPRTQPRSATFTASLAHPTVPSSSSTYPVYTARALAGLKHVGTYRKVKFVQQGNVLIFLSH
jgi:hypothetical protein